VAARLIAMSDCEEMLNESKMRINGIKDHVSRSLGTRQTGHGVNQAMVTHVIAWVEHGHVATILRYLSFEIHSIRCPGVVHDTHRHPRPPGLTITRTSKFRIAGQRE
jgi:hypothetical protein